MESPENRQEARRPRLGFAFLAHPTVQGVRFLTKVALAWFLVAAEFGEVMLAGLLVNFAAQLAVFGLDEALVYTPRPGRRLWRRLTLFLHGTGIAMTVPPIALAWAVAPMLGYPQLTGLVLVLAPWIWLNNLGVLPAAWLVRNRAYREVFLLDLWSILSFALVTLGLALGGAGVMAVVAGWYAQTAARVVAAVLFARRYPLEQGGEEDSMRDVLRYGAHMAGAGIAGFSSERVDTIGVGVVLGRVAYGLYDWALHLSQFIAQYVANVAERVLFPKLSRSHREDSIERAYLDAMRLVFTFLLPAHLVLAVAAPTAVQAFFPATWHGSAPLIAFFSLASGATCVEVVGITALKSCGKSRLVVGLGVARVALLCVALVPTLARGPADVAAGVALARLLSASLTMVAVARRLQLNPARAAHPARLGLLAFSLWSIAFAAVDWWAWNRLGTGPLLRLAIELASAALLWTVVRLASDRTALRKELALVRVRLRALPRGGGARRAA